MKTSREHLFRHDPQSAFTLIDCLVYIAVFFVVVGIGFKMFYICWDSSKAFRRNTDQIAATLKTGERWREDVRRATADPRSENSPDGAIWRINQKSGEVDYRFADKTLWRRNGNVGDWTPVLLHVKSSRMEPDRRPHVAAWRWEVELATKRKGAKVVPLFTFEAVPKKTE